MTEDELEKIPDFLKSQLSIYREKAIHRKKYLDKEYARECRWWDRLTLYMELPAEEVMRKEIVVGSRKISMAEYLAEYRKDYQYEGYDIISSNILD